MSGRGLPLRFLCSRGGDIVIFAVLFTYFSQAGFPWLQKLRAGGIVAEGKTHPLAHIGERGLRCARAHHVEVCGQGPLVPVGAHLE